MRDNAIVLFDGVCHLCNGAVKFIICRDRPGYFRFAALQSRTGQDWLARCGLDGLNGSIVLIESERAYVKSDAALRICRRLGHGWRLCGGVLRMLPKPLRDRIYDCVANNRYRWFGKRETCMIPTPDIQARFLDR